MENLRWTLEKLCNIAPRIDSSNTALSSDISVTIIINNVSMRKLCVKINSYTNVS